MRALLRGRRDLGTRRGPCIALKTVRRLARLVWRQPEVPHSRSAGSKMKHADARHLEAWWRGRAKADFAESSQSTLARGAAKRARKSAPASSPHRLAGDPSRGDTLQRALPRPSPPHWARPVRLTEKRALRVTPRTQSLRDELPERSSANDLRPAAGGCGRHAGSGGAGDDWVLDQPAKWRRGSGHAGPASHGYTKRRPAGDRVSVPW